MAKSWAVHRRQAIDAETAFHRNKLYSLAQERNTLAPINTVPVEVLTEIFLYHRELSLAENVKESHYKYKAPEVPETGVIPWLTPSHVCTSWRSTALSCSTLWDTLALDNRPWTQELLRRSGTVPLHVRPFARSLPEENQSSHGGAVMYYFSSTAYPCTNKKVIVGCFELLLLHGSRIVSLDLTQLAAAFYRSQAESLLKLLRSAKFPQLRQVSIRETLTPTLLGSATAKEKRFASSIFQAVVLRGKPRRVMSSLTHLCINGFTPSLWKGIQLPALLKLTMAEQILDDIHGILLTCPSLEVLVVEKPRYKSALISTLLPNSPKEPIDLPHLKSLYLEGSAESVTPLLRMVIAPSTVHITIRLLSDGTPSGNTNPNDPTSTQNSKLANCIDALISCSSSRDTASLTFQSIWLFYVRSKPNVLLVRHEEDQDVHLDIESISVSSCSVDRLGPLGSGSIHIILPGDIESGICLFNHILPYCQEIQYATVFDEAALNPSPKALPNFLVHVALRFPNVWSLDVKLNGPGTAQLLYTDRDRLAAVDQAKGRLIHLPRLRRLRMRKVVEREVRIGDSVLSLSDMLVRVLKIRQSYGYPVHLEFKESDPDVSTVIIERLKAEQL